MSSRSIPMLLRISEHKPLSSIIPILSQKLTQVCTSCHKRPIFNIFLEARLNSPTSCQRCYPNRFIGSFLLKRVFGLKGNQFREFASNPLYTRSVIAWLRGMSQFGIKRPQPTLPPIAIVWNFTNLCNLKCAHCYQDSTHYSDIQSHSNELTTAQALEVVDKVANSGVGSLSFSGGEPLLREDFFDVASHVAKKKLLCTVSTNGTMIDHSIAKELATSGVTGVTISLDSVSSTFHDELRGVSGAHTKAIAGLEACSEIGQFKELIIAMTLTNKNYKEIPDLINFASEIGASRVYVSRILPVGRGKALRHLDVDSTQRKKVLKDLAKSFVNYSCSGEGVAAMTRGMTYFAPQCAKLSGYQFFPISEIVIGFEKRHKEVLGETAVTLFRKFAEYAGGCATGLTYCGLSPEGDILPCAPATDIRLGNILTDNFEGIWINNPILKALRERSRVKGNCGNCKDNFICGGCRVTAFGETGDWLASDPSCPY
ncbi:MAG: radical SAM protein [Candidatus Hermodarchaeota archaeon]